MGALKKTSIYLDEELDQALAAKAAEEGVTKAEFIRRNLEVVVARPARPRLSIGQVTSDPSWRPHPDGIDGELAELYEERDRSRREAPR